MLCPIRCVSGWCRLPAGSLLGFLHVRLSQTRTWRASSLRQGAAEHSAGYVAGCCSKNCITLVCSTATDIFICIMAAQVPGMHALWHGGPAACVSMPSLPLSL